MILSQKMQPPHYNHFTALFPGPPGWAGARRELLDFMVQGKINRGRYSELLAGRHSIRTNQCPAPPLPCFYRPDALPAAQPTMSKHWRQQKIQIANNVTWEVTSSVMDTGSTKNRCKNIVTVSSLHGKVFMHKIIFRLLTYLRPLQHCSTALLITVHCRINSVEAVHTVTGRICVFAAVYFRLPDK